jgi:hypothetical protein
MDSEPFGSLFESLDRQNLWQKDTCDKPHESISCVSGIAPWLLFAIPIWKSISCDPYQPVWIIGSTRSKQERIHDYKRINGPALVWMPEKILF